MHIVPEYVPVGQVKAEHIAARLRAFAFTIKIWEDKRAHCEQMLAEYIRAREAFIAHLPELPVYITERGEIGAECPDDAA